MVQKATTRKPGADAVENDTLASLPYIAFFVDELPMLNHYSVPYTMVLDKYKPMGSVDSLHIILMNISVRALPLPVPRSDV